VAILIILANSVEETIVPGMESVCGEMESASLLLTIWIKEKNHLNQTSKFLHQILEVITVVMKIILVNCVGKIIVGRVGCVSGARDSVCLLVILKRKQCTMETMLCLARRTSSARYQPASNLANRMFYATSSAIPTLLTDATSSLKNPNPYIHNTTLQAQDIASVVLEVNTVVILNILAKCVAKRNVAKVECVFGMEICAFLKVIFVVILNNLVNSVVNKNVAGVEFVCGMETVSPKVTSVVILNIPVNYVVSRNVAGVECVCGMENVCPKVTFVVILNTLVESVVNKNVAGVECVYGEDERVYPKETFVVILNTLVNYVVDKNVTGVKSVCGEGERVCPKLSVEAMLVLAKHVEDRNVVIVETAIGDLE